MEAKKAAEFRPAGEVAVAAMARRRKRYLARTMEVVLECGHVVRTARIDQFGRENQYGFCGRHGVHQRIAEVRR